MSDATISGSEDGVEIDAAPSPRPPLTSWAGFGASAGGLEALTAVVRELPQDADAVYIVVQHLAPRHKSLLPELLRRETELPVLLVEDGVRPALNTIYVTPPNADLVVENGCLRLMPPSPESAAPKPSVDRFLISLAAELGERAIGVILSGTGSDGAYGVKAVRAAGGITIAQDARSARYYGMPAAALSTDNVDLTLPATEIGAKFKEILQRPAALELADGPDNNLQDLEKVFYYLQHNFMVDFSGYKEATIRRRIERRMQALSIYSLSDYVSALDEDDREVRALFNDLLISVTSFFRDEDEFEALRAALPELLAKRGDAEIRIWVPACATGEEAYCIAMLFVEACGGLGNILSSNKLKIFATDLDQSALTVARHATYPEVALEKLPPALRDTYFERSGATFTASRELRNLVVFSRHNILQDPPFINLDLISCRNLLIYFRPEIQSRMLSRFHYALKEHGLMFLGKSESVAGSDRLFRRLASGNIFERRFTAQSTSPDDFRGDVLRPATAPIQRWRAPLSGADMEMFDSLVGTLGPNAILISNEMRVLRSYGEVSGLISLAPGSVSTAASSLIASRFRHEVRLLAGRAMKSGAMESGALHQSKDSPQLREQLKVYPIHLARHNEKMLLVTYDRWLSSETGPGIGVTTEADVSQRSIIEALDRELRETRESLQQTVEELETSNEELQATNEELQTSNEEMQSTNEELETTNEELQSTNEELVTVNEELNTTSQELRWATHDLEHILDETPTPVIVVDKNYRISRLSRAAQNFFAIPPSLQHPHISQVPLKAGLPPLTEVVERVRDGMSTYDEYFESPNFAARISARGYSYGRDAATAVVIAITEMSEIIQNRRELQLLVDLSPVAIMEFDAEGALLRRNETARTYFGDEAMTQEALDHALAVGGRPDLGSPVVGSDLREIVGGDGQRRSIRLDLRRSEDPVTNAVRTYAIGADVTELIEAQHTLREHGSLLKMSQRLGRLGHWRLNTSDNSISWSDELFSLTGEDKDFFNPTLENVLHFYEPDDRAKISSALSAAISEHEAFSLTATLKSRTGQKHIVDWSGRPEVGLDGSVSSVIGIVRDMTHIHAREADLRRTLDELARSNAELSRFSYICSHDMREPVRTIVTLVDILRNEQTAEVSDEEKHELIERISQNGVRLLKIIDGLLTFTRLDDRVEIGEVEIGRLTSEVIEMLKTAYPSKEVRLNAQKLPIILGSEVHFRQLFQNLFSNAIKFSKEREVLIEVTGRDLGESWQFDVADNGPGVPAEYRDDIFVMFRRLNRKDEGGGSGIGLGICKKIVEQYGGKIACVANDGGGARFTFTLPKTVTVEHARASV